MANDLHKEHRKRVVEEFFEHGFADDVPEHKILELLLFYAIPRKDTNELAHELIKEFGSFSGVLEAERSDLIRVKGIGKNSATLISLMLPLFKKYQSEKAVPKPKFTNMDDVCDYIIKRYFGYKNEVFMVLSFDNEGNMIACDKVVEGDVSSVGVSVRDIVKTVLKRNAACVIISHNHTSGNALPSGPDIEMTKTIKVALYQMGVKLLDHVIVVPGDCVSMRQSRQFADIFV